MTLIAHLPSLPAISSGVNQNGVMVPDYPASAFAGHIQKQFKSVILNSFTKTWFKSLLRSEQALFPGYQALSIIWMLLIIINY